MTLGLVQGLSSAMTDEASTPETEVLSLLPTRLRSARLDKGLSLDAVAKLSGVSRSMVSQIERGESSPTVSTLLGRSGKGPLLPRDRTRTS